MLVYLATVVLVIVFTSHAQKLDGNSKMSLSTEKVNHTSQAKLFLLLNCSVLVCVAGLRYYVGTDYGGYYHYYWKYADELFERISSLNEPAYGIISAISRAMGGDGGLAIFLASLITVSICVITIYRSTNEIQYAMLLYLFMGCWGSGFNAIRQSLAAAFVFAGYSSLRDKRFIKFIICVFLAFLCHRSAIIMVLLYYASHRKVNSVNLIILFVSVFAITRFYNALFSITENILDKSYDYSNAYLNTSVNLLRIAVGIAPSIFFGIKLWNKDKSELEEFFLNLLLIHASVNIITYNSAYLARIAIYTSPFAVISIAELSKLIEMKSRKIVMLGILLLYFIYWVYGLYASGEINYRFIWQK